MTWRSSFITKINCGENRRKTYFHLRGFWPGNNSFLMGNFFLKIAQNNESTVKVLVRKGVWNFKLSIFLVEVKQSELNYYWTTRKALNQWILCRTQIETIQIRFWLCLSSKKLTHAAVLKELAGWVRTDLSRISCRLWEINLTISLVLFLMANCPKPKMNE